MTTLLERRGPQGTGRWQEGSVGLGHMLLATTPELVFERQPFRHPETGCVITADLRLDNRAELLAALGLAARRDSIGDAELLLGAYLHWGEDCLERLLGDFAFAIWDPRHPRMFCARDHFGMRALYWHHAPGRLFAFASEARAILVVPRVPYQYDEGRIADFLVPQLEWIDYTSTFFAGVHRLPPGHKATVTPAGITVAEYWRPTPGPELGPMSDEDYAQGFLEVFTKAVNSRLRAPAGTVGAMLSGGMDSGSVVAVARDIVGARGEGPLHTYSGALEAGADCAETRAILAATAMPSLSPTFIRLSDMDAVIPQLVSGHEEPFDGEMAMLKLIYLAANQQGQRVVLDGAGGDVVLGEGSYIARLIRQGRLRKAIAEIAGQNRFWGYAPLAADLLRYSRSALAPELLKQWIRAARNRPRLDSLLEDSLIAPEFARRVDVVGRFARMRSIFPIGWTPDYAVERCNVIWPNMTAGRERYGRVAAAAAAEARDPFMDKRLVDYCSRLPGHVRMEDGWPKMILRRLMANRLPDEVRWCRGKPHIGGLFHATLARGLAGRGEVQLAGLQDGLQGYADPTLLARQWRAFLAGGDADRIFAAGLLAAWLRETAERPVVRN